MKSFKFQRLFVLLFLVPTVSSLIITSVFAGKKKFKTFSFGTPLLPSIVKVEPNKFHLTFRNYKYLRTPQFKIEGTLPLKAPTIIREKSKPDPNPEVVEYNFGDTSALPEVNQHVQYDDTKNTPVFVEPQGGAQIPPQQSNWQPMVPRNNMEVMGASNHFPTHHRVRRFANNYNIDFPNVRTSLINVPNYGSNPHNFANYMTPHSETNGPSYAAQQNYYIPSVGPYSGNSNISPIHNTYSSQNYPTFQFNSNTNSYHPNHDMTASSSSYSPPKYERFNPSNQQNNRWIPIVSPSVPSVTHSTGFGHSNSYVDQNQKRVNIGEHYNPSASYMDEKVVEKPTYDPDDTDPEEGSVSFSISGPHGGDDVPVGYEAKIKEMHEELKQNPQHIPPGLDYNQVMKYYSHHVFTDPLKNSYGYKPAFGPLELLKSKLKSWKNIL